MWPGEYLPVWQPKSNKKSLSKFFLAQHQHNKLFSFDVFLFFFLFFFQNENSAGDEGKEILKLSPRKREHA